MLLLSQENTFPQPAIFVGKAQPTRAKYDLASSQEEKSLELGRHGRGVGDCQQTAHDGMDSAVIGITARRQTREDKGLSRRHRSRVEDAGSALVDTSVMRDGVVCRSRIVPADWVSTDDGGRHRHKVRGSIFNENLHVGWGGRGRPGQTGNEYFHEDEGHQPFHELTIFTHELPALLDPVTDRRIHFTACILSWARGGLTSECVY